MLDGTAAEIEAHVHAAGWDRPPALFALVRADRFAADDPETAARLGLDAVPGDTLAPVEQEALPEGPLDAALAQLSWPAAVTGAAVAQEIVLLPPEAEATVGDGPGAIEAAAGHPDRREARLVVVVLRDGESASVLRLRDSDEVVTGPDLAPNLVAALAATLT